MGAVLSQHTDTDIPETMKRLVLVTTAPEVADVEVRVEEVPVPKPAANEVLIRVTASPVNPSDYEMFFNAAMKCPAPLGLEGSGVVVASGGGFMSPAVGTKVGFTNLSRGQGAYSEYVVANSVKGVFQMPDDLAVEKAASFFINPFTAAGILDTARANTANNTFVHLAACSQVGKMMVKLAPSEGATIINVVRRPAQAEVLRGLGAEHIIVTGTDPEDTTWLETLKTKMKELKCTCVFDPIGGKVVGQMLSLLPKRGRVYTYGVLDGNLTDINAIEMIYYRKKLEGWKIDAWLTAGGTISTFRRVRATLARVTAGLVSGGWAETAFLDTTMEKMLADFAAQRASGEGVSGAKLRIRFDGALDDDAPAS